MWFRFLDEYLDFVVAVADCFFCCSEHASKKLGIAVLVSNLVASDLPGITLGGLASVEALVALDDEGETHPGG